jgi:hypothetical protein
VTALYKVIDELRADRDARLVVFHTPIPIFRPSSMARVPIGWHPRHRSAHND